MAIDLMGADPELEVYARKAQEFGLRVTSGKRPGSITSSGNLSHHDSGSALDLGGEPGAMARFAEYARRTWGSKLEELIYTPAGTGQIKNGAPHVYTGQVATDHYDHVHIADTDPADAGPAGNVKELAGGIAGGIGGAIGGAATAAGDAAAAVASGPVDALVGVLKEKGGRLLLEVALILGGAVLALWGVVRMTGVKPTDVASVVPVGRAAKATGAIK